MHLFQTFVVLRRCALPFMLNIDKIYIVFSHSFERLIEARFLQADYDIRPNKKTCVLGNMPENFR